ATRESTRPYCTSKGKVFPRIYSPNHLKEVSYDRTQKTHDRRPAAKGHVGADSRDVCPRRAAAGGALPQSTRSPQRGGPAPLLSVPQKRQALLPHRQHHRPVWDQVLL